MPGLDEALEANRPAIEAALADAQAELAQLNERKRELEQLISRGKAALGETLVVASPPVPGRMTLHEALQLILSENGNEWMTVKDLAAEVNDRSLYQKRDGSPVEPNQIHARAKNYPALFEKDGPRVRLKVG
jgi:hypothetical protein